MAGVDVIRLVYLLFSLLLFIYSLSPSLHQRILRSMRRDDGIVFRLRHKQNGKPYFPFDGARSQCEKWMNRQTTILFHIIITDQQFDFAFAQLPQCLPQPHSHRIAKDKLLNSSHAIDHWRSLCTGHWAKTTIKQKNELFSSVESMTKCVCSCLTRLMTN